MRKYLLPGWVQEKKGRKVKQVRRGKGKGKRNQTADGGSNKIGLNFRWRC